MVVGVNRVHALLLAMVCAAAAPVFTRSGTPPDAVPPAVVSWPHEFRGRPLVPVPLDEAERRFLADFPGQAARFSDGENAILMRWVTRPTRKLHPAEDCYRGWGFEVAAPRVRAADDGGRWRCFTATRGGESREVCEQIRDSDGRHFTDVSSWYWAATLDSASRPWLVTTVARAVTGD